MLRVHCILLSLLSCAACAGLPQRQAVPPATQQWLQPFADALQFVPPGMQSHWFARRVLEADGNEGEHRWLEVHAGRDFQPTWDVGIGAHVRVTVRDYGTGGVDWDLAISPAQMRPPIGGYTVWCTVVQKGEKDGILRPRESWSARVDDRFVVEATSAELLQTALHRNHSPRFGSLEPLPEIPSDTTDLVLRDLAAAPPPTDTPLGTNPGGVSAVFAFAPQPNRILVWGNEGEDLRTLLRFLGLGREDPRAVTGARGPVHEVFELGAKHNFSLRELMCWIMFGYSVFV